FPDATSHKRIRHIFVPSPPEASILPSGDQASDATPCPSFPSSLRTSFPVATSHRSIVLSSLYHPEATALPSGDQASVVAEPPNRRITFPVVASHRRIGFSEKDMLPEASVFPSGDQATV